MFSPDSWLRTQLAIRDEATRTKLSPLPRVSTRVPHTQSAFFSASRNRGMSRGSFCRSASSVKMFKGAHRFLPTLIKMEGFSVMEVPVTNNPRFAGQSHYGVWNRLFKSFADLLAVRWMKQRMLNYRIAERIE